MKTRLLTIGFVIMFSTAAYSADAVSSFVTALLGSRASEVWFVPARLNGVIPKGGYLLKFELDVDGDGEQEVFVTTNLDVERKGETWSVFRKRDTDYVKLTDEIFLGGDVRLNVENGVRKYSFYVPQKEQEGGNYLGCFWLDDQGVWRDEVHVLNDTEQSTIDGEDADTFGEDGKPDEEKIADKLKLGRSVEIDIKKVLLAKYIQDPSTPWRDVNRAFTLSQQYKDPADAADIAALLNWDPPSSP
jgi:hypothetical protein